MKAREVLITLSIKYGGDFDKVLGAIKSREPLEPEEIEKAVASLPEGTKTLTILDEDYPLALKQAYKTPLCLFYYGDVNLIKNEKTCLSYVGAREESAYGHRIAVRLATAAAKNGLTIVSGMSKGISATAMQAALDAGGKAVAILGSGLDCCYPSSSKALYDRLKKDGLIISEYPLMTPPAREHFPERNRLIAAVSHSLIVGEAGPHSSTLITVGYALQSNDKKVGAVPFQAGEESACNTLIREGAYLIDDEEDLLVMTGVLAEGGTRTVEEERRKQ